METFTGDDEMQGERSTPAGPFFDRWRCSSRRATALEKASNKRATAEHSRAFASVRFHRETDYFG